ncbi:MAG: excinuclease ABC subunit UvrC [Candidatus Omnitrophota bacterium]
MKKDKNLEQRISKLPGSPGVYKFLDKKKHIIYVGKAINLKKRVASYFTEGKVRDNRLELLACEVKYIDHISASSEAEALIYEAGLIKDHRPKYNIELKDDKSYPFLKLSINKKFPKLTITRRKMNDGALYYGPYVNVKLLKEAVSFMKKVFPLRSCGTLKKKVCLEFHLEQCLGPCENNVTHKEYMGKVKQLKKFLEGKKESLIEALGEEMKKDSKKKEYEKAISVKRRIEALTAVQTLHNRAQEPVFGELDELKNILKLKSVPMKIECFDISNISGKEAVGSMVRFVAGRPHKADYRRFRIKECNAIDDYSMIREVVRRRYSRLVKENRALPDLVIIDGGKGHLSVAHEELRKIGLDDMRIASIAKEHNHLYNLTERIPIKLSPGSRVLFLIQRIRDEAHRFAISYHRKLRSKKMLNM